MNADKKMHADSDFLIRVHLLICVHLRSSAVQLANKNAPDGRSEAWAFITLGDER
jgi:hypothetical protein